MKFQKNTENSGNLAIFLFFLPLLVKFMLTSSL